MTKQVKPVVRIEDLNITYKNKVVKARKLTISSHIPMSIDAAWANVQTPALLQFITKGMIRFRAVNGRLPLKWQQGSTYGVRMYIFGFVPFGGTHYLKIDKIDETQHQIETIEWDNSAKVWNHHVRLESQNAGWIFYEDAITIYGGWMTAFITLFAKYFYLHRQKRWQIVAKEQLDFSK